MRYENKMEGYSFGAKKCHSTVHYRCNFGNRIGDSADVRYMDTGD